MPLIKIDEFAPNYTEALDGNDIKGMEVYADKDEKIGTVSDALVDDEGHFRYFVVDYLEELAPEGIKQDLTKLLDNPKEGASALGEQNGNRIW